MTTNRITNSVQHIAIVSLHLIFVIVINNLILNSSSFSHRALSCRLETVRKGCRTKTEFANGGKMRLCNLLLGREKPWNRFFDCLCTGTAQTGYDKKNIPAYAFALKKLQAQPKTIGRQQFSQICSTKTGRDSWSRPVFSDIQFFQYCCRTFQIQCTDLAPGAFHCDCQRAAPVLGSQHAARQLSL